MTPEPTKRHLAMAREMRFKACSGWYVGDMPSPEANGAARDVVSIHTPELMIRLLLSRDKMHHSVGWWRNAEYEYCWHLSISAANAHDVRANMVRSYEEIPREDLDYWTRLLFREHIDKLWHEPGGTDPRLTRQESIDRSNLMHLRLFLNPLLLNAKGEPFQAFIPKGEVYTLTHWVPGLTPDKVDR